MRIYDPRLGRFLSSDPLTKDYPFYSPYQFAGNIPIKYIDLDGLEPAGNYKDWDVLQTGEVYWARWANSSGQPVLARAQQKFVQDKVAWKGWITHYMWSDSYQGLTQTGSAFSFYNADANVVKDSKMWINFDTKTGIAQKQMKTLARNTAIGIFGVAAAGAALPAAIYSAPYLAQAGQAGWQGARWLGKTFGPSLFRESVKEFLANRGDVSKMDWFDVGVNTLTSKFKLGWTGNLAVATLNSSVDVKYSGGRTSIFTGDKSLSQAGFDLLFEQPKVGFGGTSDALPSGKKGKREFTKLFFELTNDQVKKSTEETIKSINNGKDL